MKKRIFVFVLLILSCTIFAFAQETVSEGPEIAAESVAQGPGAEVAADSKEAKNFGANLSPIPTGQDFLLSLSAAYMFCDPNYLSCMTELPFYLDPSFKYGWEFGIGRLFSVDLFLDWNLLGLVRGADFLVDWFDGCNTWLGDASIVINVLLVGLPYLIGIFPALYYSCAGLDFGAYFFYHPYHNDWFDAKVGAGISNEPGNYLDKYGFSYFFLPMISARAEANMLFGIFKLSFWTSFNWDFLTTFLAAAEKGGLFETNGVYNINFTRLQGGVSLGFFVDNSRRAAKRQARELRTGLSGKTKKAAKIRG